MQHTTRTPYFKECVCCLRDLSLGHFGMKRLNADSYNEVCKDCKNYRKRATYYRRREKLGILDPDARDRSLSVIWPLKEHNRRALSSIQPGDSWQFLTGHHVKSGGKISVRIRLSDFLPTLEIQPVQVQDGDQTTYVCGSRDSFIETAVLILQSERIRLG